MLSEEVADLERRCQDLERQVDGMTADPVVDYAALYLCPEGIDVVYGIKDWDWDGEWPRISIAEAVENEIAEAIKYTADLEENRQHLKSLMLAFRKHADAIDAALKELGEGNDQAR